MVMKSAESLFFYFPFLHLDPSLRFNHGSEAVIFSSSDGGQILFFLAHLVTKGMALQRPQLLCMGEEQERRFNHIYAQRLVSPRCQ